MSPADKPDWMESAVAEAPPVKAPSVAATQAVAKLALGGDEIILFTLKPSAWLIVLESAKWLAALAVIGVALGIALQDVSTPTALLAFQTLAAIAALRVGVAMLQWASKLYVLSNRRVIRFRGVLQVDVAECALTKIRRAALREAWYQRWLRLGTVDMVPLDNEAPVVSWPHVSNPSEVLERVQRAIERARQNGV